MGGDKSLVLVPSIQRPRFRGKGQSAYDAPVPDGRTYQTDALCASCKNVFARSGIIFGSKIRIVSSAEYYKLSPSLDELKRSAIDLHCHFCGIAWWELTKSLSSEILDGAKRSKVTLRIEQDNFSGPRLDLYCKGLPGSAEGCSDGYVQSQPSPGTLNISPRLAYISSCF